MAELILLDLERNRKKYETVSTVLKNHYFGWWKNQDIRYLAQRAVADAIKDGRLTPQPCEKCGRIDVHAHHDKYYGDFLDVRWLCVKHHRQYHMGIFKAMGRELFRAFRGDVQFQPFMYGGAYGLRPNPELKKLQPKKKPVRPPNSSVASKKFIKEVEDRTGVKFDILCAVAEAKAQGVDVRALLSNALAENKAANG